MSHLPWDKQTTAEAIDTPPAADVGNREFLDALFGALGADEYLWTAQFRTSPKMAKAEQWAGLPVNDHYTDRPADKSDWNHYYCVAALKPAANGAQARRKDCFSRLGVVVLDDASALPQVPPTYVLETSAGNVQVGYRLSDPVSDLGAAIELHKALAAAGHLGADKNGNNPVRYVRLPFGANTKYLPPHRHRLLTWEPWRTVTLDALVSGLGLSLGQPQPQAMAPVPTPDVATRDGWEPKARKIAWDSARRTHEDPALGRHAEVFRMGAYAARDGLPDEALSFMLDEFVARMRPTNTSGEASAVNWEAERKTIHDGYRQSVSDGTQIAVDASLLIDSARRRRQVASADPLDGLSIEAVNRKAPEPELITERAPFAQAFPVPALNELGEWIQAGATVAYPSITQQAVLAVAATTVARLYTTPQGDPLSLYLGCCARSIGELRYVQHAARTAFEAAGLRRIVRNSRMTSPATIYKSLLRSPAMLYLSDDYGGVAAFSKRQPSGYQEHALSLIAGLYDGQTTQLEGPEDAGFRPGSMQVSDEQPVIFAPSLTILALIGLDQLATLMRGSEAGRGALQQMLFAIGDERTSIEQDPQQRPVPAWLPAHLRELRRAPHPDQGTDINLADVFNGTSGLMPHLVTIPFLAPLNGAYDALDDLSSDRRVRSLQMAARTIVRRIAAVLAAWESPSDPLVTQPLLDWAGAYVAERLRETIEQFEILHSTDGRSSVYDQVLKVITEQRTDGVSEGNLPGLCWAYRSLPAKKRGELIQTMIEDQAIVQVTKKPKTGRPSKRLVAGRFVRNSDGASA